MSQTEKLQEYFKFTQSDLQQNRQGRVTESQRAREKSNVQRFNSHILVVLVIMLIVGFGVAFAVRMASAGAAGGFPQSIPTAMLGPVITVVILGIFMATRTNKKNDLSLQKVEGTVNFVWVERRVSNQDHTGYKTEKSLEMRVGGVSFNVSQNLMDIINQGDKVRFYYTGGGDIISAEFIKSK